MFKEETLDIISQKWLSQFAEEDRPVAKLLLDSLVIISSHEEIVKGVYEIIINFKENNHEGPIALFVARENTGEPYFSKEDKKPMAVAPRTGIGSEGELAHLIRDIAKKDCTFLDHPSIKEMRESKCRWILIVDDIIGSGTRINKFVKWLFENRTLKSWWSLKYTKVAICAYYASEYGIKHLEKNKFISKIEKYRFQKRGRVFWNKEIKKRMFDLCKRYARYTSRPQFAYGYNGAFTLVVFPHKCPNTNPAILWASKNDSWIALFGNRPELYIKRWKEKDLRDLLKLLGEKGLSQSIVFSNLKREHQQLLLFLRCLSRKKRKEYILSEMMELTIPQIRLLIYECQKYGLIDNQMYLTEEGKKLLKAAQKRVRSRAFHLEIKSDFYYPQSLRSPV